MMARHCSAIAKQVTQQADRNKMKFRQFLTPMQLPTQKQWWSNPFTQWSQCRQCDALAGRIILHVLQYLGFRNLFSLNAC